MITDLLFFIMSLPNFWRITRTMSKSQREFLRRVKRDGYCEMFLSELETRILDEDVQSMLMEFSQMAEEIPEITKEDSWADVLLYMEKYNVEV